MTTSLEQPNGPFDPVAASEAALSFVSAVEYAGWVHAPGRGIDPVDDSPRQAAQLLAEPLIEWERAVNPNRLSFESLDQMRWLKDVDTTLTGPDCNDDVNSAMSLVASLGWVLRFWRAEYLCIAGSWSVRWPLLALPRGLVSTIRKAAKNLLKNYEAATVEMAAEKKVSPVEACQFATKALHKVREMHANLQEPAPSAERDCELFILWDEFESHLAAVPFVGFEQIYDRAWHEGGISGTCCHTAVKNLRMGMWLSLGGIALESRSQPGVSRSGLPWFIPFWTPHARMKAGNAIPKLQEF